jgi:putative ABC transport system ATP-binding protein
MIFTKNLRFSYSDIKFDFPDIHVPQGSALLITGPSGKGKTTLLHLLGGLLKAASGLVGIRGTDITTLNGKLLDQFRRNNIGIIFQQAHYIASVSVVDNLLLASKRTDKKLQRERAMELLSLLGIAEEAKKKPEVLSLGQQQRLSIARALMNYPTLLLADEPTSSLDDDNCRKVTELLLMESGRTNASLVVVSHDQRLQSLFNQKIML